MPFPPCCPECREQLISHAARGGLFWHASSDGVVDGRMTNDCSLSGFAFKHDGTPLRGETAYRQAVDLIAKNAPSFKEFPGTPNFIMAMHTVGLVYFREKGKHLKRVRVSLAWWSAIREHGKFCMNTEGLEGVALAQKVSPGVAIELDDSLQMFAIVPVE